MPHQSTHGFPPSTIDFLERISKMSKASSTAHHTFDCFLPSSHQHLKISLCPASRPSGRMAKASDMGSRFSLISFYFFYQKRSDSTNIFLIFDLWLSDQKVLGSFISSLKTAYFLKGVFASTKSTVHPVRTFLHLSSYFITIFKKKCFQTMCL
jgi:hypothetical protein